MINLDMTLMQHVFINLLENAVKYSNHGTDIVIRGNVTTDHFVIEVEDNGRGIPEADLKKVFSKFYRVINTDSQIAGTGLGLAICQSIITAHEGEIVIIIPENKGGTLVQILLPLSRSVMAPTFKHEKKKAV